MAARSGAARAAKPASQAAEKGSRRVYLLWGQEEVRKRAALAALLDDLVPPEDRELDIQYLDAGNPGVTGDAILAAARDRPMFSERRVVVVLNAGRLRSAQHARTQETLAAGVGQLPDYSTLVLVAWAEASDERAGRSPLGEKLMAAIRKSGEVLSFAPLKPDELARLAVAEAVAAGKQLTPAAAALLAERAGPDSSSVLQETRKLIAYAGDRPSITPQDAAALVAPRPDDNIFHMLEAMMAGEKRQALAVLRELLDGGTAGPQVVAMLGRTLRQVAQAKYLQDHGVPPAANREQVPAELLEHLPQEGCLYPSATEWLRTRRLWPQARRISWENLQGALDRLAVTDAGAKGWDGGVEDPELGLELFVASLCDAVRSRG